MALVLMFHAKLTPSLSLHQFSLSLQNYLLSFLNSPSVLYFSPSLLLFLAFSLFFFNCPLAPAYLSLPPPPLILCTKFLKDASFYSVPLSGRLWGLGSLSTCKWKRHREGISVLQTQSNTLLFTLLSVFYNGKLAALRTSNDSEAQSGLLTEQEQNWLM